ncbi:sigma factor-like helix-turn-helix DNA-binding protein [Nitrosococcus watsonii]|uniref:RNA polymerase sigma-70 region 4 domain-containing protein n=1 Tax=Nitrosococcus watsoni (strain C-113) TaxID=105559 RepID=D8KA15_NITWC|nr:sigma factor-like helix-turn-helix DNA-binding protein [Nitrosococcus watsonii]ADJ29373.1 hypothetical protein Nwat_2591 [Nitrosococcus watsonii C-113]
MWLSAARSKIPKVLSKRHCDQGEAIARAYAGGGYTMKEIGARFDLRYSRVSQIIRAAGETKR